MSTAKKQFTDKFQEFIADNERRRLYERESLAFDAAEMVSHLMEENNVSKAELARRIGKSRSEVTQLLSGARNMTMHSLADLVGALGYRIELKARQQERQQDATVGERKAYSIYRFASRCGRPAYVNPERQHISAGNAKPSSLGA